MYISNFSSFHLTEENWIKAANRQYKIIEDRLNELADRKQTIMKSIHELIAD